MARKPPTPPVQQTESESLDLPENTDSIEHEFGREYSEGTLDMLRGHGKPQHLETDSSLDPVEDLELYLEHGLAIPPTNYDRLTENIRAEMEGLEAMRDAEPDAQAAALVRYRTMLTQGASPEDLAWLKLRAYHRAMATLKASDAEALDADKDERLQDYEVPVDRFPADSLALTPEQLAERRRLTALASTKSHQYKARRQPTAQQLLSRPEPSDDSEWETYPTPADTVLVHPGTHSYQVLCAAVAAPILELFHPTPGSEAPSDEHLHASSSQGSEQYPTQHQEAVSAQDMSALQLQQLHEQQQYEARRQARYVTIYTPQYLEAQRLQQLLVRQRQQRTMAFWLSFGTVTGASVLRWLRRALQKQKARKGSSVSDSKAEAPQAAGTKQQQQPRQTAA